MIKFKLKKKIDQNEIGLALGGGWARGIIHIQFLKVFDRLGLKPKIIAGTSIGAIIGSLYACGYTAEQIEEEFRNLSLRNLGSLLDVRFGDKHGFIRGNRIEEFIKEKTREKNFEDLLVPLKVVATDFWEGTEYIIDKGPVYRAIRASISIPGIFEPIKVNNCVLIDGGSTNPVPYDIIAKDCGTVIAVDALGERLSNKRIGEMPSIFEAIISSFQITQEVIINEKLQLDPPDIYIKPSLKEVGPLDFHRAEEILKDTYDCAALEKKLKDSLRIKEEQWFAKLVRFSQIISKLQKKK